MQIALYSMQERVCRSLMRELVQVHITGNSWLEFSALAGHSSFEENMASPAATRAAVNGSSSGKTPGVISRVNTAINGVLEGVFEALGRLVGRRPVLVIIGVLQNAQCHGPSSNPLVNGPFHSSVLSRAFV